MARRGGVRRELAIAGIVVVILLLALFAYSARWPPVVVIESNSMMHVDPDEYRDRQGTTRADSVRYGRMGTIDPGDLVLVKRVRDPASITTWAEGGRDHYGRPGEVVVYRPAGADTTPIIHRAMTYVWVRDTGAITSYIVQWTLQWAEPPEAACTGPETGNYTCTFSQADGVTIEPMRLRNMQPEHSGYLTQGDNAATNGAADQILFRHDNPNTEWNENLENRPIRPDWIVGVARGEVPFFGLLKLGLSSGSDATCGPVKNCEMGPHPYYVQVGNVVAPKDTWWGLVVGMAVVLFVPMGIDIGFALGQRSERSTGNDWTLLEGSGPRRPRQPSPSERTNAKAGPSSERRQG